MIDLIGGHFDELNCIFQHSTRLSRLHNSGEKGLKKLVFALFKIASHLGNERVSKGSLKSKTFSIAFVEQTIDKVQIVVNDESGSVWTTVLPHTFILNMVLEKFAESMGPVAFPIAFVS